VVGFSFVEVSVEEGKHFGKISKYRFRISDSGFVRNGEVHGGPSACPRKILLRDHGIEPTPPEGSEEWYRSQLTFGIGHVGEDVFARYLVANQKEFKQEWFVCGKLDEDTEIAGSVDFIVEGTPYELKCISSTNVYEKVFVKNEFKTENLCQLANYMLELEVDAGVLQYTSVVYHKATKWKAKPEVKKFLVKIDEEGNFLVDNKTVFTVEEMLEHRELARWCLVNQTVWAGRPKSEGFFDACGLCWWRDVCDAFDSKEINKTEDFLTRCRGIASCGSGGK
jgi:hypothetical protein